MKGKYIVTPFLCLILINTFLNLVGYCSFLPWNLTSNVVHVSKNGQKSFVQQMPDKSCRINQRVVAEVDFYWTSVENHYGLVHHCFAKLDEETALLVGGTSAPGAFFNNTKDICSQDNNCVFKLDTVNEAWKTWHFLPYGKIMHMCGSLSNVPVSSNVTSVVSADVMVVAGGISCRHNETRIDDSTLFLAGRLWFEGPKLPKAVCCGQIVPSSNKQALFLVGGKTANGEVQSNIYKLRCQSLDLCIWTKITQELAQARSGFLAVMLLPYQFELDCPRINEESEELDCFRDTGHFIGDGYCDDVANTEFCNFDGGDCCQAVIIGLFCTDCKCYKDDSFVYNSTQVWANFQPLENLNVATLCKDLSWVQDGICDMVNNIKECAFDGGDCCLEDIICFTDNFGEWSWEIIIDQCFCFEKHQNCPHSYDWIGDFTCDDSTNVPECLFDGGDCCIPDQNKNNCANCTCHETGLKASNKQLLKLQMQYKHLFQTNGAYHCDSSKLLNLFPDIPMLQNGMCNDE